MKDAPPNSGSVIDAKGGFVVPGFIDAHCHLGMFGDSIGFEGIDGNEKQTHNPASSSNRRDKPKRRIF